MNFLFQLILNILEFGLNLLGFNTQRNVSLRDPIQTLELEYDFKDADFETALGKAGLYFSDFRKDPIPGELVDCFRSSLGDNNFDVHPIFKYMEQNDFNMINADDCMSFAISKKALFLPDPVSELIQRALHIHTYDIAYTHIFRECQYYAYIAIFTFLTLTQVYLFIAGCLFINPYTYPYVLLTDLVLPYQLFFEDLMPTIYGYPTGNLAAQLLLGLLMNGIRDIVFTMPFLPSEGIIQTATANVNDLAIVGEKFYVFSGVPQLWQAYGVPVDLRTDWFDSGNLNIFRFYETQYPYNIWKVDYLPMDIPRLKFMSQYPEIINPASIQRMYKNIAEYITSTGLKGQELKQLIKEIMEGTYRF